MTECDVARPFGASPRLRTVSCHERPKPDHYLRGYLTPRRSALWSYGLGLPFERSPPVGRMQTTALADRTGSPGFTSSPKLSCGETAYALDCLGVTRSVLHDRSGRGGLVEGAALFNCDDGPRQREGQGTNESPANRS